MSDRITVKIDELTFKLGPMSFAQKAELAQYSEMDAGELKTGLFEASRKVLKYTLKEVKGLEDMDGFPYTLNFEDDSQKELTDDCVEEVLNLPVNGKILSTVMQLWEGPKDKIIDPATGKALEGVKVVLPKSKNTAKKKKV